MAKFNERGEEMENKEPVEMPMKFKRPPSIHEMIAQAVQTEAWREKMEAEGRETFEEANDFDVGDDLEPDSRYEVPDDSEFAIAEKEMLDRAAKDMENEKALNEERKRRVEDGRDEDAKGTGGSRRAGKASKAGGKSKRGAAERDSEEESSVDESEG